MKPSRNIKRLIEIMAALRNPETGCPWHIARRFETILPYTIEEACEVAYAIRTGNRENLCEELGDLLFQVIYHTRLAEEAGFFTFENVVETITKKMIRRHPHVFGTREQRKAGLQDGEWQKIKEAEKQSGNRGAGDTVQNSSQLFPDEITSFLFPYPEALILQKKAAKTGFNGPEAGQALEKIREKTEEITKAIRTNNKSCIPAEYSDLFFTVFNLGEKLGLDPETALAPTNRKFRERFSPTEQKTDSERKGGN